MAIGRISGSVLKSNLTRNGVDLAFETNLLYIDVTNSRVGIGTSEPTTALQVAGTVTATAFAGDGSNLTGINVDTNIQLVGDDSTGATLGTGETFKIAGGTNITTAVSGDTLTVTGPDLSSYITATSTDILQNKTLRAPVFESGSNSPQFIEQRFVNANQLNFVQVYSGAASGSYFTQGEYQKIATIIPDGDSQNYTCKVTMTATSASNFHIVTFYAALRSNTLPDLDWTVTYEEQHNGTRFIEPMLWTKETTTAGFILAFEYIHGSNLYGNVNCDVEIIPRSAAQRDNVTINTTANSEQTSIDAGYTERNPTLIQSNVSGTPVFNQTISFEGATDDGNETSITVTDPTADRTITIPDATGTIVLQDSTDTLTNKTINSASNTITITESNISDLGSYITASSTDTLTNKTLTSAVLNTGVSGTAILDEDNMASDSATQLATQQSIKAYVDTEVGNVSTSSISQGDSNVTVTDSGTGAVTIDADGSTIITMNATTALDASGVTNAIRLPNGTTAQRPSGAVGEIRYNSSTDTIEGYTTAGGWAQLGATSSTSENTDDTATDSETAISTTEKVINQFVTGTYDSAWYLAITRDEINDEVSTAKYSLVHNDTDAFVSESHITQSNVSNTYITATADVAGGNARLKATGGSVVNSVSFYRIGLGDNTTAGTTGNVTTTINTDVDSAAEKIDGWALASYRGAKYYISVNNTTTGELSNTEALVVHDGSTAYITQYGNVNTGNNDLITLTAEVDSTEVVLKASAQAPNCRVTAYRILLADDESASTGDNVNVIEATTVSSAATTVDSFSTSTYTGAFYVFTGYNSSEGAASISEVMVVANDEAYVTQGPLVSTKGTDQLDVTASLSGSTVTVQAASTSGSSTTVNGYRVHMLRGSAGASTADTVLVSTEQTISGAKTFSSPIALTVGSDPSSVANNAHIYAKDEASSAEVFVKDEAGNVTKISPHNEQGEWEYYSRNVKTGKTVRINMEEMIRDIEKLTGKSYIKND